MKSYFLSLSLSGYLNFHGMTVLKLKNWLIFLFIILISFTALAQIPHTISYQGVLTDTSGNPKPDGNYSFTFSLYETSAGGSEVWTENKILTVTKGLFSTLLGDKTPFRDTLKFDKPYWLGIKVGNDPELSPRTALTSAGYSFSSINSDTAKNIIDGKVVKSLNGLKDNIKLIGNGGTTVKSIGDTIMIASSSSGGGIQGVKSTNGTINITNANGPTATLNVKLPVSSAVTSDTARNIVEGKVVKSINGVKDDVTLEGDGGTTINTSGNKITISSSSGGGGIQKIQNTNNTIDVTNSNGPTTNINLKIPLRLSANADTVFSINDVTQNSVGIKGQSISGAGIYGQSSSGAGIYGQSSNSYGVFGSSGRGVGIEGIGLNFGIAGYSSNSTTNAGIGVLGTGNAYGVYGVSTNFTGVYGKTQKGNGVWGVTTSGSGVFGQSSSGAGIYGQSSSEYGVVGVITNSTGGSGVYGNNENSPNAWGILGAYKNGVYGYGASGNSAGTFNGNVLVTGDLNVGGTKNFKIDDPLDPANKYLIHSCIESPDRMDVYNGNITTDANGSAIVKLPSYFQALNIDYRYQLTVIGKFAQAIIESKIQNNQFTIKTNKPNVEVSWQVTGIRDDPYAKAHPMVVEQEKEASARGKYIHPELYGQPKEDAIGYVKQPGIKQPKLSQPDISSPQPLQMPRDK